MEFRINSTLMEAFSIDQNGDGAFRHYSGEHGRLDYDIVTRRFHGGPDGFARLQALVKQLGRRVAAPMRPCPYSAPANPSWTFRWQWAKENGEIQFRGVCQDGDPHHETYLLAEQITDVVHGWAERMPIAERYPVAARR